MHPVPSQLANSTKTILSQGFWPDGIYVPPTYDAMVYDLQVLKSLGFNMVRKHIKVENDLFYQACDKMGIMLIQDMPALPSTSQPNPARMFTSYQYISVADVTCSQSKQSLCGSSLCLSSNTALSPRSTPGSSTTKAGDSYFPRRKCSLRLTFGPLTQRG